MRQTKSQPDTGIAAKARLLVRALARARMRRSLPRAAPTRTRAASPGEEFGRVLERAGLVICVVALCLVARGLW